MSQSPPSVGARLFVALQHALPQHRLSRLMYRLARCEWTPVKALLIQILLRAYRIDMHEAQDSDPRAYPHFNAFFTRALRPDARPLDPDPRAILSPVDGRVSQIGTITQDRLIQAKGRDYRIRDLLGGDARRAAAFEGGCFATLYLAPGDYHRIHMPLEGTLTWTQHVPGRLFSVNGITADLVPGLFTRNERVACGFDTPAGALVMVLVGAIFVGGIETVWAGEITPVGAAADSVGPREPTAAVCLARGAEMGRFNLGSTVILLFEPGQVTWTDGLTAGQPVRLGQMIGHRLKQP
jgi:phosphatidylserine decarboxylase